jgi:hypothetical protein
MLDAGDLVELQADSAATLSMVGELWRMSGSGRRVLEAEDVAVSIWPGGDVSINDSALGVTGTNSTYIGLVARSTDVRENDQFRNVRQADGTLWLDRYTADGQPAADGVRFTIGTVEKWPTVIRLRIHEEGT